MLLGITSTDKERKRIYLQKQLRILTTVFFVVAILPLVTWLLFYFQVFKGAGLFSSDIQDPVAKVVTPNSVGTAFLISPTKLLTARHVVRNQNIGENVQLIFEKAKTPITVAAKIIYMSPTEISVDSNKQVDLHYFLNDIAVLEVSGVKDITPLDLGQSAAVAELDEVVLIGYPNSDYSITKGSINSNMYQGLNLFKLDAASNPGNSGGPVILKDDNTVIGILVGNHGTQGENIALKIDDVKKILQENRIDFGK